MKGFTQIAHVALKVRDLDRSLDFYVGKLGFAEMMRLRSPTAAPGSGSSISGSPTTSISSSSPTGSATARRGARSPA